MTALKTIIDEIIALEGPIGLDKYMALCLGHPQHGYYMGRNPFGEKGDFVTAPEISPLFGELVGIWLATAWEKLGRPNPFNLIELGPGRGTLMADIMKASQAMRGFGEAARIHLVETSPVLRQMQHWKLGNKITLHDQFAQVPAGPFVLVANEFFDALPVRQYEMRHSVWNERVMTLRGIGLRPAPSFVQPGQEGDIVEVAPARSAVANEIGRHLKSNAGMALIIDYGHEHSAAGDTLQALCKHKMVPITHLPGESDITSHVDFEAMGHALQKAGARVAPLLTQREFLLKMGIEIRASVLAGKATPSQMAMLQRVVSRLVDEDQMGKLFKVMAAASPRQVVPYPFGE